MIYYRVAWQANSSDVWKWKSTKLTSPEALFGFLRMYRAVPQDCLRVFSSSTCENWDELLRRENKGESTSSVTAAQILHDRGIRSEAIAGGVSEGREQRTRENQGREATAVTTAPSLQESSTKTHLWRNWSMSSLEKRWVELEHGAEGQSRETVIPERYTLVQYGFTDDEIVSLLWLRQWYQNGGSDRVEVLRHWEFLKFLVMSGKLES